MSLRDLIKHFEDFSPVPYLCPAGYWTIGWGHLCTKDHPPIDEAQGEIYLTEDIEKARAAVMRLITWPLTNGQVDALTDWVFNLGAGRLLASTLRAIINRGELDDVPAQLRRWIYAGGQPMRGLKRRREAEILLWNS